MPFLMWLPFIILQGFWEAAAAQPRPAEAARKCRSPDGETR